MTLRSKYMYEAAQGIKLLADETNYHRHQSISHEERIANTDFEGISLELALANARRESNELSTVAQKMDRVFAVLGLFAPLQQKIDRLGLYTSNDRLMRDVQALGQAIDWMCARSIDAICTPETVHAPQLLADFGTMDIPSIHDANLEVAPPDIKQLAAANPDLHLLEVGDDTLVALIAPDGVLTNPSSVTTLVEGVGSSERHKWPDSVERARAAANATGGPTALWLGYRAPSNFVTGVQQAPAQRAGADLARFQRAIAQRYPGAKKIVAGHSYGSAVSGYAAKEGLEADELLFIGSPGVGARTAEDLGFGGTVTAVTSPNDIIAFTGGNVAGVHGPDPTSPKFGAERFPTKTRGSHTDYFDDPGFLEGLRIIAQR